jgi:hypothetical protein
MASVLKSQGQFRIRMPTPLSEIQGREIIVETLICRLASLVFVRVFVRRGFVIFQLVGFSPRKEWHGGCAFVNG